MVTANEPTGDSFEVIDEPGRFDSWGCIKEQVDVISFPGKLQQFAAPLLTGAFGDLAQIVQHHSCDAFAAIFGHQNQMVRKAVNPM